MAIVKTKVMIDGVEYVREVDDQENAKLDPYLEGAKAMSRIGFDLGSYAASTIKGRRGNSLMSTRNEERKM